MNIRLYCLVFALLLSTSLVCGASTNIVDRWGPVTEGLQLSAELADSTITADEPVKLKITTRNISGQDIELFRSRPDVEFDLIVRGPEGEIESPVHGFFGSFCYSEVAIHPGESFEEEYDVGYKFEPFSPGVYYITATRRVPRQQPGISKKPEIPFWFLPKDFTLPKTTIEGNAEARSNQVELTVLPQSKSVTEVLRLSAELPQSTVVPGEPTKLKLTLKNISDEPLEVWYELDETDLEILVRKSDSGEKIECKKSGSGFGTTRTVKPQESLVNNCRVDRACNISSPGTYTIIAKRRLPELNRHGYTEISSNEVALVVSEK